MNSSQSAPAVLTGHGLTKSYGSTHALSGVDLQIHPGESVAVMGPSGSGKTTLLHVLSGIIVPDAGQVTLAGADGTRHELTGLNEEHRARLRRERLGFVFQEPTLLPWRTVTDNVYLPLLLSGVGKSEAKERIDEVLAMVGLSAFAGAHPRQLSGGMKMRVSIARALVTRPKILLMDEPFAALDEITRIKLNDDLLELFARQGLTVIFVTHSVYESVYLSSRIVVMSARPGRISADIPVEAEYPRNEEYRTSNFYNERCRFVSAALRHAMTANDAA